MQLDLEDPAEFTASVLSEISMVKGGNDASCALLSQKLFRRGF